jgi:hypothetical protein
MGSVFKSEISNHTVKEVPNQIEFGPSFYLDIVLYFAVQRQPRGVRHQERKSSITKTLLK